jgi:transcriptional regulator with XRE-family HTH domain
VCPGTVREARLAVGLTMQQLAGEGLTRVAIHKIEAGKSRPSLKTLAHIAERTDRPIDWFLPKATVELVRVLSGFDTHMAPTLAAGLAAEITHSFAVLAEDAPSAANSARAHYVLAHAYLRVGLPRDAAREADFAQRYFAERGDASMVAACLHLEAASLRMRADLTAPQERLA